MQQLTQNQARFDANGIKTIAIAADQPQKMLQFQQENKFSVIIISDMRRAILKQYNVFTFGRVRDNIHLKFKIAIPSTFLIDQRGRIVWSYVGTREDRPSVDLIFQAIAENLKSA